MRSMTYDVIILGLGPVGATLANLLVGQGLRVAVVDQREDVYDKPRAITLDHEVMRIMQACGVAHDFAPLTAPHPGTHYLGIDGQIIKIFDPLPPPFPLGWAPNATFVQPQLERILRERLQHFASCDWFLGYSANRLVHAKGVAELTVHDANGRDRILCGRYVAACDGANSFVRKNLGIGLEDLDFDEWWMVVDVNVRAPVALPAKCIQYCWPSRPATFILGPGTLRRWEIKLLPGEDPEAFAQAENVVAQLSRFVDASAVEVWRSAVYRFHAVLAERWRDREVFLLGDAAHQTPPFLGQGMCAGIRDAANVAWKLALVLGGDAHDGLLDSYERERKPHVRAVVAAAKDFGQIIGELDPAAACLRDQKLRGQLERGEAETVRQRYVPDLKAGVVDAGSSPGAGRLFVQPRCMSAGKVGLLDDLVPPRFLIVAESHDVASWLTDWSRSVWRRIHGEFVVLAEDDTKTKDWPVGVMRFVREDRLFGDWLKGLGAQAVVVRPDRYVFGSADDAASLNRLVERASDALFGPGSSGAPAPALATSDDCSPF